MPLICELAASIEPKTAIDLFSGTTRIASAFKQQGILTTGVDLASYSKVFGETWLALDSNNFAHEEFAEALAELNALNGVSGFITKKYSIESRFFQSHNAQKIDAIRDRIEQDFIGTELYYPLLTSLILAADKVDSTAGTQAAYLKNWTLRSAKPLELNNPGFLAGKGFFIQGDALDLSRTHDGVDLAYLDPPYNQHRYFGNYHIWETLVRWDEPETFGIANKRVDLRDETTKSAFNSRLTMPGALDKAINQTKAKVMILSFNNEAWLSLDQLKEICKSRGEVRTLDVQSKRYIGSKIGVYNKQGVAVGKPGSSRNIEHLVISGDANLVERMFNSGNEFLNKQALVD